MDKVKKDINTEFGEQLRRYLIKFELAEADISRLTRLSSKSVSDILIGSKGIVLKTAEQISSIVFGIRYFELGNPQFPLPRLEDLPESTQIAIANRKEKGFADNARNIDLNLPKHVMIVLGSGRLELEFTSSDIWKLLPLDIQGQVKSIRITDLFKKGELKDKVEDTGEKRGREKLYRLK